ncbi:uncharacterized protein GGS22DRAFT_2615 [Annulohypoxylon maeteangense]|uniref:uncharacterized protein n=1 Tax=Annulohypoxylon maeteangense TaxID=1927788 RepID=UPI002007FBE8|nr:uncharacterized protein GGS22DRAFT_2615 [Annulohypoxylon maeteangense]KAI0889680.1 hypothetical protein GGS22DRAFT_2615 [Annulohypoxylon maeteangense]
MMSTTITTRAVADCGPKHRACDECRTRKLACTKESDGCSRCKREGIACHYSPQKPMGRPRKRTRDETSTEKSDAEPATKNTMTELPNDTPDPGLAFINLLAGDLNFLNYDNMQEDTAESHVMQDKGYQFSFGYTGDSLGDIGFDPDTPSFSNTNIDPSLFSLDPPPADQVPTLTPNTASTPESVSSNSSHSHKCSRTPAAPATTATPGTCAHTAALYLALDSMQSAPEGVEAAIRHARRATRTAYDVVFCPVCSFNVQPPDHAADIMRNFQNLMLLAALIPSIVHAYERILHAVDVETARATAERRRLVFKLAGFGGILWADAEAEECASAATLDYREMEPAMWRLTVRALLKVDVYGLTESRGGMEAQALPLHIGLKDIVMQMEQKSKARHAVMDALMASGAWDPRACGMGIRMHEPGETPTCLRVIAIAKASIDSLIIA